MTQMRTRKRVSFLFFKRTSDQLLDEKMHLLEYPTVLEESLPYLSCPAVSQICNLIFFPPKMIFKRKLDEETVKSIGFSSEILNTKKTDVELQKWLVSVSQRYTRNYFISQPVIPKQSQDVRKLQLALRVVGSGVPVPLTTPDSSRVEIPIRGRQGSLCAGKAFVQVKTQYPLFTIIFIFFTFLV